MRQSSLVLREFRSLLWVFEFSKSIDVDTKEIIFNYSFTSKKAFASFIETKEDADLVKYDLLNKHSSIKMVHIVSDN